jgi:hypothetical protein
MAFFDSNETMDVRRQIETQKSRVGYGQVLLISRLGVSSRGRPTMPFLQLGGLEMVSAACTRDRNGIDERAMAAIPSVKGS